MIIEPEISDIADTPRYFTDGSLLSAHATLQRSPPPSPPSVGEGLLRMRIRPLRRTYFGFNKPNDDAT